MNFSLRPIIRGLAQPRHRLSCDAHLWQTRVAQLRRRGNGQRESGAFLLGRRSGARRRIERFVYYDDLDPRSLDAGIVVFDGAGYGRLWQVCREAGLDVVADVHTHPGVPLQSESDRTNPMMPSPGHVALIVPSFARGRASAAQLGIYEYRGEHGWCDHSGPPGPSFFYIGRWG